MTDHLKEQLRERGFEESLVFPKNYRKEISPSVRVRADKYSVAIFRNGELIDSSLDPSIENIDRMIEAATALSKIH